MIYEDEFKFKKLNSKPRRPLTMAFQKSEYKDTYEDHESEMAYLYDRPIHPEVHVNKDEKLQILTEVFIFIIDTLINS